MMSLKLAMAYTMGALTAWAFSEISKRWRERRLVPCRCRNTDRRPR